jgi:hypothetical protein
MYNIQNPGKILYVKLVPYAEEIIEFQGVFQRGQATFDKIFTMRQTLKTDGNKIKMYITY